MLLELVMKLLQEIDPEGVDARRSKCLRRRLYYNKVYCFHFITV